MSIKSVSRPTRKSVAFEFGQIQSYLKHHSNGGRAGPIGEALTGIPGPPERYYLLRGWDYDADFTVINAIAELQETVDSRQRLDAQKTENLGVQKVRSGYCYSGVNSIDSATRNSASSRRTSPSTSLSGRSYYSRTNQRPRAPSTVV